jgi:hypothetical protein
MSTLVPTPFPFLALPVEVRLRVYGFVFGAAALYIRDGVIDQHLSQGPLDICLANREIYYESINELYSSVFLTYEQLYRSIGPGDLPLAPNVRKLIQTLVLVRKCHWTQFKLNWSMLKSYTNLKLLILDDDSLFIYSNADGDGDIQAELTDIRLGLVDEAVADIMEDSLFDTEVQQLPIIRGQSFKALVQRATANPPRTFRIGYRKIGTLIDPYDSHIMMVSLPRYPQCFILTCTRPCPTMQTREA